LINILFTVSNGIPDKNSGGPNRIIYNLIEYLDKQIFKIGFLSYNSYIPSITEERYNSDFRNEIKSFSFITDKLYNRSTLYKKFSTSSFYFPLHLKKRDKYFSKILKSGKWDIVHSHDALSMFYVSKYFSGRKIFTIHSKGTFLNDFEYTLNDVKLPNSIKNFMKDMENTAIENSDIITFPGYFARDFFLKELNTEFKNLEKIRIVNNGIEFRKTRNITNKGKIFKKYGIVNDFPKLLSVAEHIEPKRIDVILKSLSYLIHKKNMKFFLILVGHGPLTMQLVKLAVELEINDYIKIIPELENTEILQLMKCSDIFISAAKNSIYDLTIIEAMLNGMSIIADNSGGNSEILEYYTNDFLVKNLNENNLSEKICEIIISKKKYLNIPFDKFSLDTMIENYQDIYMSIVNKNTGED
jgi:glycosyltransferase involved in cell wall biosynthesis